jgi:NitT/TauT family transport system substrate-binding protein
MKPIEYVNWGKRLMRMRKDLAHPASGSRISIALMLAVAFVGRPACAETLRLAVQKTGTFAWELDVIGAQGLAKQAGLDLDVTEFATPEAAKIALAGGAADMILTDWLWVSRERTLGRKLVFKPYSTAVGAVLVPSKSPVRRLEDLDGKRLAVAGGPLDKSWLLLRALALRTGFDIAKRATILYGAPALLYEKTANGDADASLTYWTYGVALEARGFRRLVGMDEVERQLGAKGPVAMVGYVFDESIERKYPGLVDRFLAIADEAKTILAGSDAPWERIGQKLGIRDQAQLALYRTAYLDGISRRTIAEEEADARALYLVLAAIGGAELVGPARELDPGTFYKRAVSPAPAAR